MAALINKKSKSEIGIFEIGTVKLTTIETLLLFTLGFIPAVHLVFWLLVKLKYKVFRKVLGVIFIQRFLRLLWGTKSLSNTEKVLQLYCLLNEIRRTPCTILLSCYQSCKNPVNKLLKHPKKFMQSEKNTWISAFSCKPSDVVVIRC